MTKKTRIEKPIAKTIILNWRVTPEEKEIIRRAADMKGKSVALFVMDYIMPHAKRIIANGTL